MNFLYDLSVVSPSHHSGAFFFSDITTALRATYRDNARNEAAEGRTRKSDGRADAADPEDSFRAHGARSAAVDATADAIGLRADSRASNCSLCVR